MQVGIDLGTTNSAVGIFKDGTATLVPNSLGELLTPSAVSIEKDGTTHVGAAALDRLARDPENTATSFKRLMGTSRITTLQRTGYKAEDLSALVLRSLCDDVAAHTGERPREAVITVPAYFNDRQRKATRRAGELAGLEVRRLINEPTAAALAFGLQDKSDREPFLVFDLGGGTFDVSIVEMFEGIVEVRASAGDNRLGGDDFDEALAQSVLSRLDPQQRLTRLPDITRAALLKRAAQKARCQLSGTNETEFAVTIDSEKLTTIVREEELEVACAGILQRLRDPVVRSLRDCEMDAGQLSEIVLVGGATRMPIVRRAITRMFGRFPDTKVHPDHAVALGAAIQAGLLARDAALDEVRITDVCPFTMGIEVIERDHYGGVQKGLFSPIIERNTAVPVSRVRHYQTVADNQKKMALGIFQGEAREVEGNIKLGSLDVPLPPRPAGEVSVNVRFTYDSSGLLEIDVSVPTSGLTRNLVIIDEEDRPGKDEIEKRRAVLAKLKFHPREAAQNVALMARAERLYEDFIGEQREWIGHGITQFAGALDSQDPRHISDARKALIAQLDAIEGASPL
jgi:molecular chaperone HscC